MWTSWGGSLSHHSPQTQSLSGGHLLRARRFHTLFSLLFSRHPLGELGHFGFPGARVIFAFFPKKHM